MDGSELIDVSLLLPVLSTDQQKGGGRRPTQRARGGRASTSAGADDLMLSEDACIDLAARELASRILLDAPAEDPVAAREHILAAIDAQPDVSPSAMAGLVVQLWRESHAADAAELRPASVDQALDHTRGHLADLGIAGPGVVRHIERIAAEIAGVSH